MHRLMGDHPASAGSFMPPATTRRFPERPTSTSREARIVPPFVPSQVVAVPEVHEEVTTIEPETVEPELLETVAAAEASPDEAAYAAPGLEEPITENLPVEEPAEPVAELTDEEPEAAVHVVEAESAEVWESRAEEEQEEEEEEEEAEEEGVVEPAFEADSDAALRALGDEAAELSPREDFPLEAFIVPEQADRLPTGMEEGAPAHSLSTSTPVGSLAERLEKLSHRLRVEETDAIVRRLAAGDRLDALLAGLLAGYLAGKSEQQ